MSASRLAERIWQLVKIAERQGLKAATIKCVLAQLSAQIKD